MLGTIVDSLAILFNLETIFFIVIGVVLGIIVGALPGLGAILGMVIILPFTIPMDGTLALITLLAVYAGAMYGASISGIILNVPGSAAAAATTLDGYPMTRDGKAIDALSISAFSSSIGGILSVVIILIMLPALAPIVRAFRSHHIFLLALIGILMIPIISQRTDMSKGIVSGLFGVSIMTIGISPGDPYLRYTFDLLILYDGLEYVAIIVALFAIGEMIHLSEQDGLIKQEATIGGSRLNGISEVVSMPFSVIRSSVIGLLLGMIPGAGSATSNYVAYAVQIIRSKKDKFGEGLPSGVVASESSNNATVAGSLIPVLAFGIPGSGAAAILLGAFLLHGLTPGAELLTSDSTFTYSLLFSLIISNIIILLIGLLLVPKLAHRILSLDKIVIIPTIVILSTLGVYAINYAWLDIATLFIIGIMAYYMKLHDYSLIAMVLGAVLSPILEQNYTRSLQISEGSHSIFVGDPLAISMIGITILLFTWSVFRDSSGDEIEGREQPERAQEEGDEADKDA